MLKLSKKPVKLNLQTKLLNLNYFNTINLDK